MQFSNLGLITSGKEAPVKLHSKSHHGPVLVRANQFQQINFTKLASWTNILEIDEGSDTYQNRLQDFEIMQFWFGMISNH